MLPGASFNDLFYPMTAEIYYADTKQDELGSMKKTWVYDRTIKCSAISQMADKTTLGGESKQKKKNGTFYPITEILITDIKDPNGEYVWEDVLGKRVQFEVKSFVPGYDFDHTKKFYRAFLARSKNQQEVLY